MELEQGNPIPSFDVVLIYCSQKDALVTVVPFHSNPFCTSQSNLFLCLVGDVLRLTLLKWLRLLAYFDADFTIVDDEKSTGGMWLWGLRM